MASAELTNGPTSVTSATPTPSPVGAGGVFSPPTPVPQVVPTSAAPVSSNIFTKVPTPGTTVMSSLPTSVVAANASPIPGRAAPHNPAPPPSGEARVLDKRRLQELVKEVDPLEQLDDEVEEVLMNIADDFIDNVVTASCQLAKHRKANSVEVKDVQLHLERNWNMWIPGFGNEELKPLKKSTTTEAHKQRMALIKKTLKKY